jgi:hypothetical protein
LDVSLATAYADRGGGRVEKRVTFDFEITFTNGGSLSGLDFRLDLAGDEIEEATLADYLVCDMRLLMVDEVRIRNKRVVAEAHKRTSTDRREQAYGCAAAEGA